MTTAAQRKKELVAQKSQATQPKGQKAKPVAKDIANREGKRKRQNDVPKGRQAPSKKTKTSDDAPPRKKRVTNPASQVLSDLQSVIAPKCCTTQLQDSMAAVSLCPELRCTAQLCWPHANGNRLSHGTARNPLMKLLPSSELALLPQGAKEEDKEIKWEKLRHAGVLFPPEYVRLPSNVRMLYDGQPVDLTEEQEEVAQMFAIMKETDYMKKQLFLDNFWNDFKKVWHHS